MAATEDISCLPRLRGGAASKLQPAGLLGSLALAIARLWHSYWHWRTDRALLLLLQSLDERTLMDIGVTRRELSSCRRRGAPPSNLDCTTAAGRRLAAD